MRRRPLPSPCLPVVLAAALGLPACQEPLGPAEYPPGPGPGPGSAGQLTSQDWGPGATPPLVLPPPGPPVGADPVNDVDLPWLRAAAGGVLQELVGALPPDAQARVAGIPFVHDDDPSEVNAYAACNRERMPLMAMTDGILRIEAYMAQMRATDDVFGTRKLDAYLTYVAANQKPNRPILAPPQGLVDPVQHHDYRKVVREHQLLEEQMAFVLGHELAHHYLGHTGCAIGQTGRRPATLADIGRRLSHVVGTFNQFMEGAADTAGVHNLLSAGARRRGYRWTEGGALLTLEFFSRLQKPEMPLLAILNTHPNPAQRVPNVQGAAAGWRRAGGAPPPVPMVQ